jgi:glycosyltransferase involved in cell wall biosynthesis
LKLACVIHRFGADIAGGSEGHCRAVALQLAGRHDVTILTTCARDHVTWRNEYAAGESSDGALRVRRFQVAHLRSLHRFHDISEIVFNRGASEEEEEEWFRENGPDTPELIAYLREHGAEYDRVLFWSFRYYQTYFGLPVVADRARADRTGRALLVPTAENDPALWLHVVGRLFTRPAGFVFLTPEEQALVARSCPQPLAASCVIGVGLNPAPARPHPPVDLSAHGISAPFLLYLGRIDPNKGCYTLLRHFVRWQEQTSLRVPLVLAGPANMPIPDHPLIRFLGYVDETVRDALLATATALVVPSPYESLSIVLLEAWNHGTPALVNGECEVLKGQTLRADGGLYYQNFDEFARALEYLLRHSDVARQLGQNGLAYVEREYRWPHVINTLETFLASLDTNL